MNDHLVTASCAVGDNKWQRVEQQVTTLGTTSENEWKWTIISVNFWEEPTNRHPKENPLNPEEYLEEDLLN